MKIETPTRFRSHGISLFEMMLAVTLLGLIVGIALPCFGGGSDGVRQARDLRNAQTVSALFASAQVAGVDFTSGDPSVEEIVRRLVKGVKVEKGVLKDRTFALPNLGEEEMQSALPYLALVDGALVYHSVNRGDLAVAMAN